MMMNDYSQQKNEIFIQIWLDILRKGLIRIFNSLLFVDLFDLSDICCCFCVRFFHFVLLQVDSPVIIEEPESPGEKSLVETTTMKTQPIPITVSTCSIDRKSISSILNNDYSKSKHFQFGQ